MPTIFCPKSKRVFRTTVQLSMCDCKFPHHQCPKNNQANQLTFQQEIGGVAHDHIRLHSRRGIRPVRDVDFFPLVHEDEV